MRPRPFKPSDVVVIDYETSGFQFDPGARVFAASLTWVEDGYTEVWRENGAVRFYNGDEKQIGEEFFVYTKFKDRLNEFWSSECQGVAHNLKFELHFTARENYKINPKKQLHDTMIMHQYIDNLCRSHALDYLFNRYHEKCAWISDIDKQVSKAAKIYGSYDKIPHEIMWQYQLADGVRGALLYQTFWPLVEPVSEYYNEIELIKTTVKMERRGFMVDKKQANDMMKWMNKEIADNEITTRRIVGRYINLLSEKQLKQYLFVEQKIPPTESIDKDDIVKIDHPIVDCVLRARAYTKGVATVRGYLEASEIDGSTHPNIWTNKAATGRETSDNPNMQNVSKEVRAGVKYNIPARRCFRARPGYVLLLVDYAGIEMRLAVQGTGDLKLAQLCADDYDFHSACATSFYGIKFTEEKDDKIKKALRSRAKTARFAMLYGAGLEQTAATLGLTIEEVRAGYERDKKDFPEFYELMDRCTHDAKKLGYVTTFFGRKLRVPQDRLYAATDFLIQGSAAALFKHAQVKVDHLLERTGIGHLIIPVHDELVMEIKRGVDLREVCPQVRQLMIDQPEITVKLETEFSLATYTWDAKHDFHF